MRGKTNIPPRKQPVINGDVENFVVASGNTIAKGDFVSYVLNNQYTQFDSRNMTLQYKYEYDEVNHKFFLVFTVANASPVIMLAQVTQGDIVVLDSIDVELTQTYGGACIDGDNIFVCDAPSSVSYGTKDVIVKKYSIVNDEIVFVQDYTNTLTISGSGVSGVVKGIAVKGLKIYFGVNYKDNSYSRIRVYYGSLGEAIPYNRQVELYYSNKNTNVVHFIPYVIGNYIVVVSDLYYSSSYQTFIIAAINTTLQTMTDSDVVVIYNQSKLTGCDIFGSKICCVGNNGILIVSFDNGIFTTLYDERFVNYKGSVVGRIAQDKIVVYFTNPNKTRTLTIGETIQHVDNEYNFIITENENSLHYILSDFSNHVLLECSNANGVVKYYGSEDEQFGFVLGEPTNYVQSYNGGFTVGFAKTGGTAGDTIQVYVPHNNS